MRDEFLVVEIPVGDRVVVFRDPGHRKERVAQLFKSFLFAQVGKNDFGPFHGGHADHAPLPYVVHRVGDQVRHLCVVSHVRGLDLLTVHIRHNTRLVRQDRDIAGPVVMLLFGPVIFPLGHIGQHLFGLILISHLCKVTAIFVRSLSCHSTLTYLAPAS